MKRMYYRCKTPLYSTHKVGTVYEVFDKGRFTYIESGKGYPVITFMKFVRQYYTRVPIKNERITIL